MEELEIQFRVAIPEIEVTIIFPSKAYMQQMYLIDTIPTVRDCSALWWCIRTSLERLQRYRRQAEEARHHRKAEGR